MFQGILPIDRTRIPAEILAGITLASLAVPEVMGYTKIAGTPVITGLYTALVPALLYALFCSSRHLVVGADSATAAILASALAAMSITDPAEYMALASLLALMAAGLLLIARFLKLGFLASFLSRSVLIGFLTGVGIQVAMSDVTGLFGIHPEVHGAFAKLSYFFGHMNEINLIAMGISVISIAAIIYGERISGNFPIALVVVVVSILASWALDFKGMGLHTLGALPVGLPNFSLPDVEITKELIIDLLPVAMSMFVVILAQSAATSRAYADRYEEPYDADVDLMGLAAANIGAGLSGTFVVNGSPTKTEMLDSAGGRSQLAQIAAVGTVLVVLLFLTRPLAWLPTVVLSVIVFLIGVKLINIRGMKELYQQARNEFWIAIITALTVVLTGVKEGILLALVLSLLDHIGKSYRPRSYVMIASGTDSWTYAKIEQAQEFKSGLVIYHFTHTLYYANMQAFSDDVVSIEHSIGKRLKWLAIEASAMNNIDYSGAQMLKSLVKRLKAQGVALVMCDVAPHVVHQLQGYGLIEQIGADKIFDTPDDMLEAYQS